MFFTAHSGLAAATVLAFGGSTEQAIVAAVGSSIPDIIAGPGMLQGKYGKVYEFMHDPEVAIHFWFPAMLTAEFFLIFLWPIAAGYFALFAIPWLSHVAVDWLMHDHLKGGWTKTGWIVEAIGELTWGLYFILKFF